jgi:hypothetical protein
MLQRGQLKLHSKTERSNDRKNESFAPISSGARQIHHFSGSVRQFATHFEAITSISAFLF